MTRISYYLIKREGNKVNATLNKNTIINKKNAYSRPFPIALPPPPQAVAILSESISNIMYI